MTHDQNVLVPLFPLPTTPVQHAKNVYMRAWYRYHHATEMRDVKLRTLNRAHKQMRILEAS